MPGFGDVAAGDSPPRRPAELRPIAVIGVLALALAVAGALALSLGAVTLSPEAVFRGLFSASDAFDRNVVWQLRLPRILAGALVGGSLAIAGTLLQTVTRNPLADPTILGMSAAAGMVSSLAIVINPQVPQSGIALAAVSGGVVGAALLFVLARGGVSGRRLALCGVALSAFFGAGIIGMLSSSRTFLQTNLGFLAGGLYGSTWEDFRLASAYAVPAGLMALLMARPLNALALGDEVAAGLGVATERTRAVVLLLTGILTGAAVSVAGLVSFVGLMSPHVARFIVGQDSRFVIPASALTGGLLVVLADLGARLIIRPAEIPMGIITAGIGAPFLLYLVRRRGI